MKVRNEFLDILKGALIILVVIGHVIQVNYPNTFDQIVFFRLIYSFHMPLFIFLSGYVAFLSEKEQLFTTKVWRKFFLLIIPFLSWYFLYKYIGLELYKTTDLISFAKNLIVAPDNGYWFLYILFLCFLILYILKLILSKLNIKSDRTEILIFLGTAIFVNMLYFVRSPDILGLELLKWHLPSFLLGYLIAKHKDKFKKYFRFLQEISILAFPFFFYFWSRNLEPSFARILHKYFGDNAYAAETLFRYLTALFAGIVFISIIKTINNKRIKNILNYLGKRTFEVYTLEFLLFGLFGFSQLTNGTIDMFQILLILISASLVVIFSVLVAKYLFEQSTVLKLLFFGRLKK